MTKAVVDRFEGRKAVLILIDGQQLIIDKKELEPQSKEGSVVFLKFRFDPAATAVAGKAVKKLVTKIFNKKSNVT